MTSILRRQDEILARLQYEESTSNDKQVPRHVGHPPAAFPSNTPYGTPRVIYGPQASIIHGDHITTDMSHHATNVNSGNVMTTTTTQSNNDTSVKFYGIARASPNFFASHLT